MTITINACCYDLPIERGSTRTLIIRVGANNRLAGRWVGTHGKKADGVDSQLINICVGHGRRLMDGCAVLRAGKVVETKMKY